jgi:hypothetical protein
LRFQFRKGNSTEIKRGARYQTRGRCQRTKPEKPKSAASITICGDAHLGPCRQSPIVTREIHVSPVLPMDSAFLDFPYVLVHSFAVACHCRG